MATIRRAEFDRAVTQHWGGETAVLGFPDTQLLQADAGLMTQALMSLVRGRQFEALISFAPDEQTRYLDHPDHVAVGRVVQQVAALADVAHFLPGLPALKSRPALWYWTTGNRALATHQKRMRKTTHRRPGLSARVLSLTVSEGSPRAVPNSF